MRSFPVALMSSIFVACGAGGGASQSSTDEPATAGSSSTGPTGGSDSSDATPTSGASGTSSTSDPGPTTAATTSLTTTDATTGEPGFCHGWQTADGAPYLELYGLDGAQLVEGGTLSLECGPQGSFMFGLYPKFGGFTPASDQISFDIVVDVDGQNTNPEGHFYSTTAAGYYVGCEDLIGGVFGVVPVIPPDNADVLALDGLAADVHVVMHTPAGDVVVDLGQTLAAIKRDTWEFCGG